jgi:hypothetical protein
MKALALAALLTASLTTGASAACNMLSATPGTWEFDAATGVWEATTPATYVIKVRNASEIYVKATDDQGLGWNEKTISNGQIINGGTIGYRDPGTSIRAWDIDNTVNNGNGQNVLPTWNPTMSHNYQGFHGPNNNNTALLGTNEEQFRYNGTNPTFKFSRAQVDLLNLTNMTSNDWWIFEIKIDGYFLQSNPNSINTGTNSPNYLMYHTLTCKDGSEHDTENTWGGTGTSFATPSCVFSNPANGDMSLQNDGQTWNVANAATITIDFDNINRITVEPENGGEIIGGPDTIPADIDYLTSTVSPNNLGTQSIVDDLISITGLTNLTNKSIVINIDGEAEPTSTVVYDANTNYRVPHVITCVY